MKRYRSRGQSLLEYSLLVAIVAAAFIGMQFYMKRAIQGRTKQAADEIGQPYDSQKMIASSITTTVNATTVINSTPKMLTGQDTSDESDDTWGVESNISIYENVTRTGGEHLGAWGEGSLDDESDSSSSGVAVSSLLPTTLSTSDSSVFSDYTFDLVGDHTLEEVQSKFSEIYSNRLAYYGNVINAVADTLSALNNDGYIVLHKS